MVERGERLLDGFNKLLIIPGGNGCLWEWIPMGMRLMVVMKALFTTENPWSFKHGYFMTSSTRALERNGTT
jgi:hypothetical protein